MIPLGFKHSEASKKKMSLSLRGKKFSDKRKLEISNRMKGRVPWNKGKKCPQFMGNVNGFKAGGVSWNKGKKRPPFSEEWKRNLSKAQIGRKHTEETKRKIAAAKWLGGKSFEPYTVDWKKIVSKLIRQRDNYICQICHQPQADTAHDVHHIDYNKVNNEPDNLITLCKVCHMKTNYNRDFWKDILSTRKDVNDNLVCK